MESTTKQAQRRIDVILELHGNLNFSAVAKLLNRDRGTVRIWYDRARWASQDWAQAVAAIAKEPGHAGLKLRKHRLALSYLADMPRCGAPCTYSAEQYTQVIALALALPADYHRPITHWSARELADEVQLQEIAVGISSRQIQRFLQQADLKPHRSRYWLNPKIDDREKFEQEARDICQLYDNAQNLHSAGVHVISVDEKTGIQALERIAPTKPMKPGKIERIESEYKRHGTLCLIPSFEVATGRIVEHYIGETRNEQDFACHLKKTIDADPDAEWVFVLDQLNTHSSATLVELVSNIIGTKQYLGQKGKSGILKSVATRKRYLSDSTHRIRFVYTPKHCSWLNQVEIWFSILAKKLLKRGNFKSKKELLEALTRFISYFNQTMAKPFKWTCKGLPLSA